MKHIRIEVQHSRKTITDMVQNQYASSHKSLRIVQVLSSLFSLLIGIHLIGNVHEPINYLFILYGCFSLVFINVPAKSTSQKLIKVIEESEQGYPCSIFNFEKDEFTVTTKGPNSKIEVYRYSDCYQLIAHRRETFYYLNSQAAFIFPEASLSNITVSEFRMYLEEKTGLKCQSIFPLLTWSIWSLFGKKK